MFNKKKKHFKEMLRDANKAIWELELKKFTLLHTREKYRTQFDNAQSALETIKARLKANKDDKAAKEQKKQAEEQVERVKGIIDALDAEINGRPPSEKEEGKQGVNDQLAQWIERRELIEAFIEEYC